MVKGTTNCVKPQILNALDSFSWGAIQDVLKSRQAVPLAGRLFRCGDGKGQDHLGQAVLIGGIRIGNVRLGFLEFGLRELDDGTETQVVASLGEVESEVRLLAKLLGDGEALVSAVGVLPGDAHIARDGILKIGELLTIDIRLQVGGFGSGVVKEAVENGDVDVDADGAVPVGNVIVSDGSFAYDAESIHGWTPEVVFGAAKFLRRFYFELQGLNFRPLLHGLLDERLDIGSRRNQRSCFLNKLEILLVGITEDRGKRGKRRLIIVASFEHEQLGARQLDFGEAEVELGFEFGVGQGLHFVNQSLPGIYGFLRDTDQRLGVQRIVEGLIDGQKDIRAGSCGILVFGFGTEFGAGKQVGGAAKIGDQLAYGGASGGAREKSGIVQE